MSYVTAQSIKISDSFKRDYDTYKRWEETGHGGLDFSINVPFIQSDDGLSPIMCMYIRDTYGELEPCNDVETVRKVMNGKCCLNWQIQQWAEGIHEGLFCLREFQDDFPWLPEWVWDSLMKQVWKLGGPGSLYHVRM